MAKEDSKAKEAAKKLEDEQKKLKAAYRDFKGSVVHDDMIEYLEKSIDGMVTMAMERSTGIEGVMDHMDHEMATVFLQRAAGLKAFKDRVERLCNSK